MLGGSISPDMNAISRKLGCDVQSLQDRQDVVFWQEAYRQFVAADGGVLRSGPLRL